MMLVLLNDVDDSRMLHNFDLCACACNNGIAAIFKNWHTLFRDEINDQCLSASVWKMKTKKEAQMLEHSSYKERTFMQAEGLKRSILVSII